MRDTYPLSQFMREKNCLGGVAFGRGSPGRVKVTVCMILESDDLMLNKNQLLLAGMNVLGPYAKAVFQVNNFGAWSARIWFVVVSTGN